MGLPPLVRAFHAVIHRNEYALTPDFLGEGLARGAKCTVDLSQVDHLSIAHLPLAQVRERFSMGATAVASEASRPPV